MKSSPREADGRRRLQYDLQSLAILVVIVGVTAAIYGGLVARGPAWPVYDILACAAPLLLLGVVGVLEAGYRWYERMKAEG